MIALRMVNNQLNQLRCIAAIIQLPPVGRSACLWCKTCQAFTCSWVSQVLCFSLLCRVRSPQSTVGSPWILGCVAFPKTGCGAKQSHLPQWRKQGCSRKITSPTRRGAAWGLLQSNKGLPLKPGKLSRFSSRKNLSWPRVLQCFKGSLFERHEEGGGGLVFASRVWEGKVSCPQCYRIQGTVAKPLPDWDPCAGAQCQQSTSTRTSAIESRFDWIFPDWAICGQVCWQQQGSSGRWNIFLAFSKDGRPVALKLFRTRVGKQGASHEIEQHKALDLLNGAAACSKPRSWSHLWSPSISLSCCSCTSLAELLANRPSSRPPWDFTRMQSVNHQKNKLFSLTFFKAWKARTIATPAEKLAAGMSGSQRPLSSSEYAEGTLQCNPLTLEN